MAREFARKNRVKVRGDGALKISNTESDRREEILSASAQLRRGRERACMLVCVRKGQEWLGNFFQIRENVQKGKLCVLKESGPSSLAATW